MRFDCSFPVNVVRPAVSSKSVLAVLLAVGGAGLVACPSTPYPEAKVELTPARAPPRAGPPSVAKLRFSVAAMQSPQDTFSGYSRLLELLGRRIGTEVELVQRRTYAEVNELLAAGQLDAALLCTGGYFDLERRFPKTVEILAVPTVKGAMTYHAYLIVPAASRARSLADLRGKRFAYTDDLSLTGHRYVVHRLQATRQDPGSYFSNVQFTHSHDRSIEAVAKGVVDGATVDSLIFDQLAVARPWIAESARIIERSAPFGSAPLVASMRLPASRRAQIRAALLGLGRDPAAVQALSLVGFDGFARPTPGLYDSAAVVLGISE